MLCEICHQKKATRVLKGEGEDDEKYVCEGCAEEADQDAGERGQECPLPEEGEGSFWDDIFGEDEDEDRDWKEFPLSHIPADFRFNGLVHLEGINLVGEIADLMEYARGEGLDLRAMCQDNVLDAAHAYKIYYDGPIEKAKAAVELILDNEQKAREEMINFHPLSFEDTLARDLAVLRSCKVMSPLEFFDFLSPLRIGAIFGWLEGITTREIETIAASLEFEGDEGLSDEELDKIDAALAKKIHKRFEKVEIRHGAD